MAQQQNKEQLSEFISGLGPGQLVGRQVSCDWRRPGHVTSCSPLIGPGPRLPCPRRHPAQPRGQARQPGGGGDTGARPAGEQHWTRGLSCIPTSDFSPPQSKPGSKVLPAPWVKVYLVSGKKCLAKAKTGAARRTLDPLFQQQLIFHQRYGGCVLQVGITVARPRPSSAPKL